MKTYVIFILFLVMLIPVVIKYRIMENELITAQSKPSVINFQSDSTPFKNNNLNGGWAENLKIPTPTGAASNLNNNFGKENPFAIDPTSRQQREWKIDSQTNAEDTNVKRVGKTCNFGLCLPGN